MPVAADAPLHTLRYAVVDVETTGRAADGADRITEVAVVQVDEGRIVDRFTTLVRPGRPIPPPIVRLTGISDAMVASAPPFRAVADAVHDRLDGRVFVAHNAPFDRAFVDAELARAGRGVPVAATLCTVRLARRLLAHLPRRNLDAVTAHFGIRIAARHRALGDAEATALVLLRLLDALGREGVHTWGDFEAWATPRGSAARRRAMPSPVTDFRIA